MKLINKTVKYNNQRFRLSKEFIDYFKESNYRIVKLNLDNELVIMPDSSYSRYKNIISREYSHFSVNNNDKMVSIPKIAETELKLEDKLDYVNLFLINDLIIVKNKNYYYNTNEGEYLKWISETFKN